MDSNGIIWTRMDCNATLPANELAKSDTHFEFSLFQICSGAKSARVSPSHFLHPCKSDMSKCLDDDDKMMKGQF